MWIRSLLVGKSTDKWRGQFWFLLRVETEPVGLSELQSPHLSNGHAEVNLSYLGIKSSN